MELKTLINAYIAGVPWFWPGMLIVFVLSILGGIYLHRSRHKNFFLTTGYLLSIGLVIVSTCTPSVDGFKGHFARILDTSVAPPIGPNSLFDVDHQSLNVTLFVPLGLFSIIVAHRILFTLQLVLAAFLLVVLILLYQWTFTELARTATLQDIVDNGAGVLYGAVAGVALRISASLVRRSVSAKVDSPGRMSLNDAT